MSDILMLTGQFVEKYADVGIGVFMSLTLAGFSYFASQPDPPED